MKKINDLMKKNQSINEKKINQLMKKKISAVLWSMSQNKKLSTNSRPQIG